MKHRPEHDAWSKQVLLGEGDPVEIAARSSELESCEICAASFSSKRRLIASLDRAGREASELPLATQADGPELSEMVDRFEREAMQAAMPAPVPRFQLVPRLLTIAAALILGAVALYFYTETKTISIPDGGGTLGGEILVQHPEENSFVWNRAGYESFTVTVRGEDGKEALVLRDYRQTRLLLDEERRAGLVTGKNYEIQVTGKSLRPGQKDSVSEPLRFSAP